jgi:hypothetical protein
VPAGKWQYDNGPIAVDSLSTQAHVITCTHLAPPLVRGMFLVSRHVTSCTPLSGSE